MLLVIVPGPCTPQPGKLSAAKSAGSWQGRPTQAGERARVLPTAPPPPTGTSAVGVQTEAGCFGYGSELGEKAL